MTTPAGWAELVAIALLGTDRRTQADAANPVTVLDAAARHQVLDRLGGPAAGLPATVTALGPAAPAQGFPEAPVAADRLLERLLHPADADLVSCWLEVCAGTGRVVAAVRWTPLARLAARSTAIDRRALGSAFGPRGRWFLHQNPDWRRLAADAEPADRGGPVRSDPSRREQLTASDVLADPELLLRHPHPWAAELVSAAYAALAGEGQSPPKRSFATRLGLALPAELYPTIAAAGEYHVLAPDASPARRRATRDRFVALESAAYARAAIQHAFITGRTDDPGLSHVEIPDV